MHPDCDHTELKQMIADCKETMDKDKKKTNEGIGFTSSIARSLIQEFGYKLDEAEEFQFSPEQEKFLGKANRQDPYILARMPGPKPPFSYFKDPEDQAIAKQMNFGANNLNKIKNLVGAGTQGDASTFAAAAPAKMRGGDPAAAAPQTGAASNMAQDPAQQAAATKPAGAPELVGTQNQAPDAAAQADRIANRMDQEAGANTMGQTAAPAPTAAPVTTPAQRATAAAARARAAAKAGADASDPSTQTKPAASAVSTPVAPPTILAPVKLPPVPAPVAANSAAADRERDGTPVAPDAIDTLRKNAGLPAAPAAAFNPGKDSQRANVTALATEVRAIADAAKKLGPNATLDDFRLLFDRLKKVETDAAGAGKDVKSAVRALVSELEAELKKASGGSAGGAAGAGGTAGAGGAGGAAWSYVLDGTDEGYAMSNGFVKDGRADLAAWRAAGSPGKPKPADSAPPAGSLTGDDPLAISQQDTLNKQMAQNKADAAKGAATAKPGADGAVGQDLARMGVTKQQRLNQAFVDKTLGAGYTAGSAESNLALQAHFKKQGVNQIGAAPAAAPAAAAQAATPVPVPPMPNPNFRTGTMAQRDAWLAKYGKTHNMDGKPAQAMRESKFDESVNLMRRLSTMLKGRLI